MTLLTKPRTFLVDTGIRFFGFGACISHRDDNSCSVVCWSGVFIWSTVHCEWVEISSFMYWFFPFCIAWGKILSSFIRKFQWRSWCCCNGALLAFSLYHSLFPHSQHTVSFYNIYVSRISLHGREVFLGHRGISWDIPWAVLQIPVSYPILVQYVMCIHHDSCTLLVARRNSGKRNLGFCKKYMSVSPTFHRATSNKLRRPRRSHPGRGTWVLELRLLNLSTSLPRFSRPETVVAPKDPSSLSCPALGRPWTGWEFFPTRHKTPPSRSRRPRPPKSVRIWLAVWGQSQRWLQRSRIPKEALQLTSSLLKCTLVQEALDEAQELRGDCCVKSARAGIWAGLLLWVFQIF